MRISKKYSIIVVIILSILAVLMLFPFLWMVSGSIKSPSEIYSIPPTIIPENPSLTAYELFFDKIDFFKHLSNSLIIVVLSLLGILICAMTGYGFAKFNFKFKEPLFMIVLATMMIPGSVLLIPNLVIISKLGLMNTYVGMVLPSLVSGFSVFLFRQFMSTISDEVIEAARMEGASEFQIFIRVILPLSKPVISIQALLVFIGSWNSYLWPSIVATSQDKYPLTVAILLQNGQNVQNVPLQLAASTIMVVPVIIIFLIMQKNMLDAYNVEGSK